MGDHPVSTGVYERYRRFAMQGYYENDTFWVKMIRLEAKIIRLEAKMIM